MNRLPLKKFQSITTWFLLVVYSIFVTGCSYYRVKTVDELNNESIVKTIKAKKKYVILHTGTGALHLKDVALDNNNQAIAGVIEEVPLKHQYFKKVRPEPKANRYVKREYGDPMDRPIYEIHIYTNVTPPELNSQINIPFSTIEKIEVYDTHVGATIAVWTASIVAVWVALAIVVAATKSSCPFVYTGDGEAYTFSGEMFGGAIYPQLERDDYMPLPGLQATKSKYDLIIANELLEKQYINLAELVIVSHPEGTDVVIDKNGNVQTLTSPQSPVTSLTDTRSDYSGELAVKDSVSYLFDQGTIEDPAVSSLTMSFKRPADSKVGKLVINAKNSFWLDYVYGKFNELFGMYYNTFAEDQKEEPAEKLEQWSLDQNIPLSVYIETEGGWKFVDYFNSIGPLAGRDVVMPIDLSGVRGEEVRIKLESGFRFWEVDYVAMDFSSNVPVEVNSLAPASAIDENGIGVSDLISATDEKYLVQPNVGNAVTLKYNSLPPANGKQTVFLHSRGYYEYIRDYENFPDLIYLNSFKEKGAFSRFSKDQFDAFDNDLLISTAALAQRDED